MTTFHLDPQTFSIPGLRQIDGEWAGIPDAQIRSMIVVECQYLEFHSYLLEALSFRWQSVDEQTWISGKLDHSTRAGMIKAAILVYASVIEAALRAHAEHRGYAINAREHVRTFGVVMRAWDEAGRAECAQIWDDLCKVRDYRNLTHLYRAATESKDWRAILQAETEVISSARAAVTFLKALRSN